MNESIDIKIRNVKIKDVPDIAELFRQGFPESLEEIYGKNEVPKASLEDIFNFLAETMPECFFVAEHDTKLIGYIVAPPGMKQVWKKAILRGYLLKAIWGFLSGKYNISFSRLLVLAGNKLNFMRIPQTRSNKLGQILSIAVYPPYRRCKVGKRLVGAALGFLDTRDLHGVKLEVRPENINAVKLYESFGFVTIGLTKDSQGPWLIMKKTYRNS